MANSILEFAKPSSELSREKYYLRAFLIGDGGSGKTVSATTLPGKKLLIDADNGAEAVAGFPDVSILRIPEPDPGNPVGWELLKKLKEELWAKARIKDEPFPYDSIIIDSATALGRYALNWSLKLTTAKGEPIGTAPGGGAAQPHYGPQMNQMTNLMLSLLGLPCHVCFTAHIDLYQDESTKKIEYWPKFYGKIRTEVSNWFGESYVCTKAKVDGKMRYYWVTDIKDKHRFIKSRLNTLGKYWTSPVEIDLSDPSQSSGFTKLLDLRFSNPQPASALETTDAARPLVG
jgi:AAA domain